MKEYVGFIQFLEEVFKDLGYEVRPINGNNARYTQILIRQLSKNFVISWQIEKAHFDTRNYPHIVWKDAEDLKKQLIDMIEVFIKS